MEMFAFHHDQAVLLHKRRSGYRRWARIIDFELVGAETAACFRPTARNIHAACDQHGKNTVASRWHGSAFSPSIGGRVVDVNPIVHVVARCARPIERFAAKNIKFAFVEHRSTHPAASLW